MRISTESDHFSYGDKYIVITDRGVQTGLFFRSPFRRVNLELYSMDKNSHSFIEWSQRCRDSILFRIYNYLLRNGSIVKAVLSDNFYDDPGLYGFSINCIICPIYFKRNYRALDIINMEEDDAVVDYVTSFGYDDEYVDVRGECNKEITKIHTKYQKTEKRIRSGKKYLYTYDHIAKELVKTLEAGSKKKEKKDGTIVDIICVNDQGEERYFKPLENINSDIIEKIYLFKSHNQEIEDKIKNICFDYKDHGLMTYTVARTADTIVLTIQDCNEDNSCVNKQILLPIDVAFFLGLNYSLDAISAAIKFKEED